MPPPFDLLHPISKDMPRPLPRTSSTVAAEGVATPTAHSYNSPFAIFAKRFVCKGAILWSKKS
jgi:hypothetical protein